MDTRAAMQPTFRVLDTAARTASVDIVIPVLNEERALPGCVRTLAAFLDGGFPLPWRITIVDNGSTDATWPVAIALAGEYDRVHARRIEVRGRGAALRAAWRESRADIVAYMDVDLSTDLDALFPLVAAVASGHSEIAIGTRLGRGARIRRSIRREVISRGYNALLRHGFRAGFSDAQCGFKAARARVVRPLMDKVEDDGWFFDTELLLLAEHNGLRVHEVPVDWVEDLDSRVRVVRTAVDDLRGLARVAWSMAAGRARVPMARPEPAPRHPDALPARARRPRPGGGASAGTLHVLFSAVLYAMVYWPMRDLQDPATAATCAFVLAGTAAAVLSLRTALFFAANLALAVALLHPLPPQAGRMAEVGVVVAAYCLLMVIRAAASPLTRN
ncbi:Undecaprenyl-phosphate 4-deoxy-4-formamido-L-arabinose transferase [Nonomuraea coxensis DSM 45129]|uniref:Undecaprenyl-phosphate 4-deoxy-4-formamido-L-arabinose transferase n=1 Tax=Nonomuraea coxensis DSM 45129 TaxID=1122611 RepID=A0ABX8TSX3_9ACTN|nr:glycosyltransferase [Nonomuraea coxensis]QYC38570.1 Undecaprenyl-phosphate 4-deoxy-4-formamido-L-arabinose transferase [Nonomuraea coxensis DSM 45129]